MSPSMEARHTAASSIPRPFDDRQKAEAAYRSLSPDSSATVTKVERRKTLQQPPLLYDLTALQKDCNVHLDLPAAKTLDIAQSLYEKKLISYPRTGKPLHPARRDGLCARSAGKGLWPCPDSPQVPESLTLRVSTPAAWTTGK